MAKCSICKEKWTGLNRCHCTGCHKTFNSVGGFDKHRQGLKCANPESIGMIANEEGIWSNPMPESYRNKLNEQNEQRDGEKIARSEVS